MRAIAAAGGGFPTPSGGDKRASIFLHARREYQMWSEWPEADGLFVLLEQLEDLMFPG